MPSLENLVGQQILAHIPTISPKLLPYHLHAVESSGLWVGSEQLTASTKKLMKVETAAKALVVFVPFHQIHLAMGHFEVPDIGIPVQA